MEKTTLYTLALATAGPLALCLTNLTACVVRLSGGELPLPVYLLAGLPLAVALAAFHYRACRPLCAGRSCTRPRSIWFEAAVIIAVLVFAVLSIMRRHIDHDAPCHYPLVLSMGRGNVPAMDLTYPKNYLPYHYAFDLAAALVHRIALLMRPYFHVEMALDLTSALSLGLLLVAVVLLLAVASLSARPGLTRSALPVLVLVALGGGLVYVAVLLGLAHEPWNAYTYSAFHPLLQYLGRRSTVLGQAVFVLLVTHLFLALDPRAQRWPIGVTVGGLVCLLALSSIDLLVAWVGVLLPLLTLRGTRQAAFFLLASTVAAAPVLCIQGGLITSLLFNDRFGDLLPAISLHAPAMPGWYLGTPGITDLAFWGCLVFEVPLTVWLLFTLLVTSGSGPKWDVMRALVALALVFLVIPLVLTLGFSGNDIHRLFLLPQLLSFIFCGVALERLRLNRRMWAACFLGLVLVHLPGPLLYARGRVATFARQVGQGRYYNFDCAVPRPMHDQRKVWLASKGQYDQLLLNGVFMLSAPFGTYGPGCFDIPPELHEKWHARYLADPLAAGATHAVLNADDYETLKAAGVPHQLLQRRQAGDEPVFIVAFSPET